MDNLDYLDAYDEDIPDNTPHYSNGSLGGIISGIIAWIVFLGIVVTILGFIGSLM
jgi:hypothetical protein